MFYIYIYIDLYTCVHTCRYIHTHAHTHTHTYIYIYILIHTHILAWEYMYIPTYLRTYIHTLHTYTHTYVRTYIHTHIHTYIHTHIHTSYIYIRTHIHITTCLPNTQYKHTKDERNGTQKRDCNIVDLNSGQNFVAWSINPPCAEVSKIPSRNSKSYSIHMGKTMFQTKIYVNINSLWIWCHCSSKLCSLDILLSLTIKGLY